MGSPRRRRSESLYPRFEGAGAVAVGEETKTLSLRVAAGVGRPLALALALELSGRLYTYYNRSGESTARRSV